MQNFEDYLEGVARRKTEGLPLSWTEKKLMARSQETVFSLRFAWLGCESRPEVKFGIHASLCLTHFLAFYKRRENRFFMRPFEVLYEKIII